MFFSGEEDNLTDDDENERFWVGEPQYLQSEAAHPQNPFESVDDDSLINTLQGLRYSGVGLFANNDRNLPWKQIYSNLRMRGKRSADPLYPWQAIYSLRGKKTVANLPWQMGLKSPMLRGKKSSTTPLPWEMTLQSPMLRGKKEHMANLPEPEEIQDEIFGGKTARTFMKQTKANLPWEFDYLSPMMRG